MKTGFNLAIQRSVQPHITTRGIYRKLRISFILGKSDRTAWLCFSVDCVHYHIGVVALINGYFISVRWHKLRYEVPVFIDGDRHSRCKRTASTTVIAVYYHTVNCRGVKCSIHHKLTIHSENKVRRAGGYWHSGITIRNSVLIHADKPLNQKACPFTHMNVHSSSCWCQNWVVVVHITQLDHQLSSACFSAFVLDKDIQSVFGGGFIIQRTNHWYGTVIRKDMKGWVGLDHTEREHAISANIPIYCRNLANNATYRSVLHYICYTVGLHCERWRMLVDWHNPDQNSCHSWLRWCSTVPACDCESVIHTSFIVQSTVHKHNTVAADIKQTVGAANFIRYLSIFWQVPIFTSD